MQFEPSQAAEILGPLGLEDALSNVPLFGRGRADVDGIIKRCLQSRAQDSEVIVDEQACKAPLPKSFTEASTIAARLRALRSYSKEHLQQQGAGTGPSTKASGVADGMAPLSSSAGNPTTNRELHEELLSTTLNVRGFPVEAQTVLDHVALLRAKEKYLFDCELNRTVVSDDLWLRDVWAWIGGGWHRSLVSPKALTAESADRCREGCCWLRHDVTPTGSGIHGCFQHLEGRGW